jgi:pimeloyl-ACP methyl ester carboxylesterase
MILLILFLSLIFLSLLALTGFAFWTTRQVEARVPPIGRFETIDGVRLHFVDRGSGPVVVMLHGLAAQLQNFTYALADRLPDCRLIIIDRPGCGYSQAARTGGLAAQARLVDGLLERLGVQRAFFVGHSLGGALSLVAALNHPRRVAGLALVAPLTQPVPQVPGTLRRFVISSDALRWVVAWTIAIPVAVRSGPAALAHIFAPDPPPRDYRTRGGGLLSIRPRAFRAASRDFTDIGQSFPALAARFSEIEAPIGILFGTGDTLLDYRLHGEGFRKVLPSLHLELIEGHGHMLPIVLPERTAEFIRRMMAKAGLGDSSADQPPAAIIRSAV